MATMQPAASLQLPNIMSPSGLCLPQHLPTPVHQEKVTQPYPQTQSDACLPKDPVAPLSRQAPRLRAVVESQAFKNILVDEMDMMVSRAATVIQANWKGYRLRQKLISQMTAAKAIQEAWRRFSTRRLMRSNKLTVKKVKREEEGDIPYHPPQQVRFHAPEDQPPVMVSKETQFPSSDSLVPSYAAAPGPCASGVHRAGPLPQQFVTGRLTGPKYPPCMLTKTVRSSCLIRHLEGDSVKGRHVAPKPIQSGTPESAALGRYGQAIHGSLKTQTQVHTDADVPKALLHMYPVNKTPTKVCPVASTPKSPATATTAPRGALHMCPTSPATGMKMQSPTCPTSPGIRPLAHVRPSPSFSSTTPQVRPVVPMARAQPPGCAVTSTIKASPRLGGPVSKGPPQTGSGAVMAKTSPQIRPVTRSQAQACTASTSSKTSSQSSPTGKPSPQTRLAAMITKTPAQIRSVAAVLRTLCLVPTTAASSPRNSPQTPVVAGIPNTPSQVHLSSPKAKVTVSTKQTTTVVKMASHSYLAEGKGRCGPQGHLDTVVPNPPAKSPSEVEKVKPGPPRAPKKEVAPKNTATIVSRALSWTKVTEDRSKPLTQIQQRAEVVKVHSRVYMPEEITVTLSQAQLAVPLTKASSQAQPPPSHPHPLPASPLCKATLQSHTSSGLATGLPEGRHPIGPCATLPSSPLAAHLMSLTAQLQPAGEQTRPVPQAHLVTPCPATASPQARSLGMAFVLPEGYSNTCPLTSTSQHHMASHLTKSSLQLRPPAEHAKTTNTKNSKAACQVCPHTKLSKAPSLAQLITCLAKVPSQAHLPAGLSKAQSQAQLASETAKCLLAAHPATDLSSKTQSQPLLSTTKASVQFWQHFGTLNTGARAKPDDRSMTQPQVHNHAQNKATQNPRSVATDTQGMLVPLLTPSGHHVCNSESWGDSGRARTPPPPPMPSQAVSCHEDLAASIASLCADLVAMLGSPEDLRALLAKTLSQGEVRTALSQALSREVLGPSVVKALPQGMLGMALMKALSWSELGITLSRALSRGELRPELSKATQGKLAEVLCKALTEDERATLSQALCQGELGAVFTQSLAQMAQRTGAFLPKATSKTVGSRMTTAPAPMEVTCSGSLSVAWGPALGPVRARCSKVRSPWKGLPWGQPDGILWGKGDGATLEGSPCLPQSPVDSFSGGMVTSTHECPLHTVPTLLWEKGPGLCSGLCLRPDLDLMACGEGPHVPKRPSQQPPPCPWQPLVTNGAGPSSNQPPVTSSTAPSSHQPPVASRVSFPWASYREGNVATNKHSGGMGGEKYPVSQQPSTTCPDSVCQCANLGIHKRSPCGRCSSIVKGLSPSPRQTIKQVLPPGHRLVSPLGNKEVVTIVRDIVDEQHEDQSPPVCLNPKLQKVSSTSTPKQERYPQASLTPSHPWGQATGRHMSLLDELLATFPQHPQIVLAKSYPRGSAAHCQDSSDSHSSLQSSISASLSTPSSLTSSEVLEGCKEGDGQEDPQPVLRELREVRHRRQGHLENSWPAGSPSMAPQVQRQPAQFESFLLHSTSLALNVHWDSDNADSGSDYSTGDLMQGLSQDTTEPWYRRGQAHTGDLQPNGVTQLDSALRQGVLADGRAPRHGQAPEASEGSPCLSQPLEATRLCPGSSQPAGTSSESPRLAQPSMDTGVAPSLPHPSVPPRVFPTLAQPSMDTGVSPTLTETLMYYGLPTNFSQPFLYYGGSPIYTQPHQPHIASGVPSDFAQKSGTGVVALSSHAVSTSLASSQAQPCATTHIAPKATLSPVKSWPPPASSSVPIQGSGHPDAVQTSVATGGVSPNFFQPFMSYSMPSNFTQPCMATLVTPNFVQPSVSPSMSPSLAQPFVVSVMSPTLTHASVANRASKNLSQPTTTSPVVPGVLPASQSKRASPHLSSPLLAPRVCSNLAQPSVATLGALSLLPPTVVCGVGRGGSKPASRPQQHAQEDSSTTRQSQPSVLTLDGSYPGVMSRLGQPSLGVCGRPGDKLMIGARSQPSPWDPTVHSEPKQVSKGPPGPVTQPMASAEDGGLALGASVPCQNWFRGIVPGAPQGPVATGLFLSMCQGANPPPMAAWALPADVPWTQADVPWTQEQAVVTSGVGQGSCPAVIPSMQVPSEFFPNQLGTSVPQTYAPLPVTLEPQLLSVATMVPPSCRYAGMVIPGTAVGAVGRGLVQGSVDRKVPSVVMPKPVIESETLNLPQGSVIRGIGKSVPPESRVSGVAQSVPPEFRVSGVAQSVPPEFRVSGVAQSVPPESMVSGVAQSVPPEFRVSGVAQSVPPEFRVSGVAQSVPPESRVSGVAQSVPPESRVSGVAQSVPPEFMVSGVAQSVPPEFRVSGMAQNVPPESRVSGVAQNVPPEFRVSGVAQSVPPEFRVSGVAQSVPPEFRVSGVAQSVPPEFMVSGVAQSVPSESRVSGVAQSVPPEFRVSGVAQSVPPESRVSGVAQSVPPESMVGGVAQSVPPEFRVSGVALSVPPESRVSGMAQSVPPESRVSGVAQSVPPESMVSGMAQSVPPESRVSGVAQSVPLESRVSGVALTVPSESRVSGVAQSVPSESRVSGMNQSVPPESRVSGMNQSVPPEFRVSGMAQSVPSESRVSGVAQSVPPESMVSGMAQSVPSESRVSGVAQSVPPESMVSGVAQGVPPESTVGGVAQSVPPESMVSGVAQSVPSESMVSGVAQSVPSESMVNGVAQSVLSESRVSGVAQSVPPESMVDDMTQSNPPESVVDGVAQSVPPESVVDGVAQSVPPESLVDDVAQSDPPESLVDSMAKSVPTEFMVGGMAQSFLPESMVGVKAQKPPPESMVPLQDSVALSLPPGSVASSVAPSHPQETGGRKKLSPAVESLSSSHSPGPCLSLGFVASGTGPSMPLGSVASNVAPGSMVVGLSPRPYQAAQSGKGSRVPFLAPHITSLANAHSSALAVQRVSQVRQSTLLLSASQSSPDSGLTKLVSVENPTLPKPRQIDNTVSATLESGIDTARSEGLKTILCTGLSVTGGEDREQETLPVENILKNQVALLAEGAPSQASDVTPVLVQVPSLGEHPTANSITPVQPSSSESHDGAPSLYPVPGFPNLQEHPVAGRSSQPPASNVVTAPPQPSPGIAGAAKSLGSEEEPQSHRKSNHRESPTAKKSCRSTQSSLVSELLEGSMDRLLPFSRPLKPLSQISTDSHKRASGTPAVGIIPIIHLADGRGQKAPSGVGGVSLSYESSPNDSQRPLVEPAHDTRHTGKPRTVLALTTQLDQRPPFVTSPGAGYDGGSRIHSAPHGHKHQHVPVPKTSFDEGPRRVPTKLYGHRLQHVMMPKTNLDGSSQLPNTPHGQKLHRVTGLKTGFGRVPQVHTTPHGHKHHLVTHPKTGHNKISPPPTVPQGPVDTGQAGGQSWNSKVPNVPVRATARAGAPQGTFHSGRGHRSWNPSGAEAALDRKPSAELLVSVRAMEKVVVQAAVTIQACARGYLVRRTVKVWHQWATIIQATWRGYRVRRNLARLLRATTIIQASWRGYCTRRDRAHQVLLPTTWAEHSGRTQGNPDTRNSSEHRCFLSCQPDVCSVCQSLGPRVESPPSVVMLVGSQPRTCHVCGHTLSTRVVQGFGQGISVQSGSRWASASQQFPLLSQQHRAATLIQAVWKGYRTRRLLSQQQSAAKMVQATWRGHYTRSCLTTDALLGTGGPWNISRDTSRRTSRAYCLHWPGV